MMWWSSSSGEIELNITKNQADTGYHSGPCDWDINELRKEPTIRRQLNKLEPDLVRRIVKESGMEVLPSDDHSTNLDRLLWLACGDIVDETN